MSGTVVVIGTRIAHETSRRFLLVSLVRAGAEVEHDIEERFGGCIHENERHGFLRLTWEKLENEMKRTMANAPDVQRMSHYFAGKALGYAKRDKGNRVFGVLRKAFY